jgi:hypothetical protein
VIRLWPGSLPLISRTLKASSAEPIAFTNSQAILLAAATKPVVSDTTGLRRDMNRRSGAPRMRSQPTSPDVHNGGSARDLPLRVDYALRSELRRRKRRDIAARAPR